MKFVCEYRSSDNVRHELTVEASDREAAFSLLRGRGIRPSRLVEAPGFANKLFGKGKRWLAIAALAFLSAALAVILIRREAVQDWTPSPAFRELDAAARAILPRATNDLVRARSDLKTLFIERFAALSDDERERDAARALYGRIALKLDQLEAKSPKLPVPQ